jgi:putative endonuclease
MAAKDRLGQYGEQLAARYLTEHGLQVIATNWRCRHGEIDIIAREGGTVVFCEVKTRSSAAFGEPAEAVGRRKVRQVRELSLQWLAESSGVWPDVRFDVLAVYARAGSPARLQHLRGAF